MMLNDECSILLIDDDVGVLDALLYPKCLSRQATACVATYRGQEGG